MPKTFYQTATDIPADQLGSYVSKNGRWELTELDGDHPTIANKTELETTQRTLKSQVKTLTEQSGDLQTRLTLAESKVTGDGLVPVTPLIKELGEAAQSAGYKKPVEIADTKTRAENLQKQIDGDSEKQLREQAAQSIGKQFSAFDDHATARQLKLAKKTEKINDTDVDYFVTVSKDADGKDIETRLSDYVKTSGMHISDAKTDGKDGFQFGGNGKQQPANEFDGYRQEVRDAQKTAATMNAAELFTPVGGTLATAK